MERGEEGAAVGEGAEAEESGPEEQLGGERAAKEDGRVSRALRLRQERRAQILVVARRLFAERGYHETSIQDILQGASIARGTFYLHFDSKRAIFSELIEDFVGRIRAVVTQVDVESLGAAPPLQQIEENLDRVFVILRENRDMTRILLRLTAGLDHDADATLAEFYERMAALLRGAILNGQRMGLVRACDAAVVAQAALGSLKEVVNAFIVQRDSEPAELRRVSRELLAFSLRGIFAGAGAAGG